MAYTTIDDPTIFFNTVLFTGTASGNKAVTGVGFQPDWVWTKNRVDAYGHNLYDSVRGTGKYLQSNGTSAESSSATSMVSFDSNGFTVGTGDNVQYSSNNGVSWNWKAGGSASSNSNGSITSSVSASTDAGFSIVSYTGTGSSATIGHGLGVSPSMIIAKQRSTSSHNWVVQHKSLSTNNVILLDTTGAVFSPSTATWDSGNNSSSVFGIATNDNINASSETYIAYCFAEKKGYSKFSSYVGNGSDTQFIYTGFAPAFVLWKNTNESDNHWCIIHNKAETFNGTYGRTSLLRPNDTGAEIDGVTNTRGIDFLSNGFCLRSWGGSTGTITANESGDKYIFMCFAENPFVTSTGVPACAR